MPQWQSSPEAFTEDCGAALGTNVNQDQTKIYCVERMRTGASSLEVAELSTCDSRKASDTLENDCSGEDARRHTKNTVASCVLARMRYNRTPRCQNNKPALQHQLTSSL